MTTDRTYTTGEHNPWNPEDTTGEGIVLSWAPDGSVVTVPDRAAAGTAARSGTIASGRRFGHGVVRDAPGAAWRAAMTLVGERPAGARRDVAPDPHGDDLLIVDEAA
jgi:hypothetical protein